MNKKLFTFKKLMTYIGMSLVFVIIGYLILYLVAMPVINVALPVWNMVKLSSPCNLSDEYEDTFKGSTVFEGTVKSSDIKFPSYGDRYANLKIPSAGIDAPVFWGDGDKQLKLGLGHYLGSNYPGMGSTVLIAGHNHTFLHTIDKAVIGDEIILTTDYGVYTYVIDKVEIASKSSTSVYDLNANYENLVLYTCYPLTTLGLTSQRYYVCAKLKSGPTIYTGE